MKSTGTMAVVAVTLAFVGAAAGAEASGQAAAIPTPPRDVLERALRSIDDPMFAQQVRADHDYEGADCVVHLGLYRPLATAEQLIAINRASKAWRATVVRELGEQGAEQMIGSSVNPLIPTPEPLRQAAAAWCVANAPQE